ncbi:hypothetical protein [Companilactobacillus mishanensis]|uniref:hypothetical protein n=1 Tax=Companilactobacillus mishanensis TaxID=2486008 RepID=UPI0012960600|nr:hypothetical protein [Companilactobacillus mishanensis]MQS88762.1 hypothetical protein [Companilactobacillus mishanensis]
MEILLGLSSFVFVISILTIIGFFITWLVGLIIKRRGPKTTGKLGMIFTSAFLLVSFVGAVVGTYNLDQQNEVKVNQTKTQNKNFKKASAEFENKFLEAGGNLETIGTNEYKSWGDKIDNSDDDFDVDIAVADIVSDNSSLIEQSYSDISYLKSRLKTMSNNDTGKYNLKDYKTAYDRIAKFQDFVSYPTGSYDDFSDKVTMLDDNVSSSYHTLNK